MKFRLAGLVLGVISAAASATDLPAGANVLVNGTFDTDLSGWLNPWGYTAVWSSADADGDPGSGSAHLQDEFPGNNGTLVILVQCLPVSGGETVRVAGDLLLPVHADPLGFGAGILVFAYSDTECSADPSYELDASVWNQSPDWQHVEASGGVPAGARSLMVGLGVAKRGGVTETGHAYFDNLFVGLWEDGIFTSGFEP